MTLEEKIVTYADKLIEKAKVVPIENTISKFSRELGADHPALSGKKSTRPLSNLN